MKNIFRKKAKFLAVVFCFCCCFLTGFLSSNAYPVEWGYDIISLGIGNSNGSQVAMQAVNVLTIYYVYNDNSNNLQFIKTITGGTSWSSPVKIDTIASGNIISMAINGANNIYVLYLSSASNKLTLATSINAGQTWATSVVSATAGDGVYNALVWTSLSLNVAYSSTTNLKYAYSTNNGSSWTITTPDAGLTLRNISLSVYNIAGTETDTIVYSDSGSSSFKKSVGTNGGTWVVTSPISGVTYSYYSNVTTFVTGGVGNSYICYTEENNGPVGATFFLNTGTAITSLVENNVTSLSASFVTPCAVSVFNGGLIYIIYVNYSTSQLKLAISYDNGVTWWFSILDSFTPNSGTAFNSISTSLVDVDKIFVAYSLSGNRQDIKLLKSLPFPSYAETVQNISGIGVARTPIQWSRIKDAATGDNLQTGLLASVNYEFDGTKFNQVHNSAGSAFWAVKYDNLGTNAVTYDFGFRPSKVVVEMPITNTDEVCVDWLGNTAVCPGAGVPGDDRLLPGSIVIIEPYNASSISVIANSGTQTVYIRAFK